MSLLAFTRRRRLLASAALAAVAGATAPARALAGTTIFRCQIDGKTHLQDGPCPETREQAAARVDKARETAQARQDAQARHDAEAQRREQLQRGFAAATPAPQERAEPGGTAVGIAPTRGRRRR